ncbi:MAG: hypothetical protein PVJ76_14895 [Gemmatimonadota bacterium]|jgi:predicted nucleic acid-binding protein
MSVFVDTSVLYVLLVRTEEGHDEVSRAFGDLAESGRRGVSLVDCSSFHLMNREGIRDALSLDSDFAEEGFRLLPALPS